jgi:hypothetical protein
MFRKLDLFPFSGEGEDTTIGEHINTEEEEEEEDERGGW